MDVSLVDIHSQRPRWISVRAPIMWHIMRVDIYASALRPHALTSGHSACTLSHPKSPSLNTHFISFSYIRFVRSQLDPDDEAFPDKRLRYIATSAEAAERRASPRGKSVELQYPSTIPSAAVIRHMRVHPCT